MGSGNFRCPHTIQAEQELSMNPLVFASKLETIPLEELRESLATLRLTRPNLEETLRRSLERHGQMTPLVVWPRQETYEVIDGFKRLRAARRIPGLPPLTARLLQADAAQAKQAILMLNRVGSGLSALEEAWVIQALCRDDQMTQTQIALLLGRHQSWVSRRLALIERLDPRAQEDVRLGLLPPATARTLARMPRGIQTQLWGIVRREGLSSHQTETLASLLATPASERHRWILEHPREALQEARQVTSRPAPDPRLSKQASELELQCRYLERALSRVSQLLNHSDLLPLPRREKAILQPRLLAISKRLSALTGDLTGALSSLTFPDPPPNSQAPSDTAPEPSSRTS
jgi:ParB family chromosome partitioning protein